MKSALLQVHTFRPRFGQHCYVAQNATVSGDVVAGEGVTIWFQAVIRGDVNPIRIGDMTNIQDGAVVHGSFQGIPTTIGNRVTIGHKAIIHGCTIEDEVLIGMGAIILDEAVVESGCIVGAGSVVLKGMHLKAHGLYVGSPAKRVKEINEEQKEMILRSARNYATYPGGYTEGFSNPNNTKRMNKNNYVVIMAGGVGSRFWPFSRTTFPKQFHDVMGTGKTMIQQTAERFRNICPPENLLVVTNKDYAGLVKEQLPYLSDHQILMEPMGRNTAPCLAYATFKIHAKNPQANLIISPADHVILREDIFEQVMNDALQASAGRDILLTLGMKPTRPDTGYGYIQFMEDDSLVKKVKTFTEKPQLEIAMKFIESGEFVWNSGMFIWNVAAIMQALEKHQPEMFELFHDGAQHLWTEKEQSFVNQTYPQCKSISIDNGIMEKAENVYVMLADFGWSDLGTWKSLYELSEKDAHGNVVNANAMLYDTYNSMIRVGKDKLVVIEGVDNLIVAEADGVIMICQKEHEQKVKDFVADARQSQTNKRYI